MSRLLVFLHLCFYIVQGSRVRVWQRIPKFFVDDKVINFINQHRVNNCYEFQETPTNLLLKCWRDNKLTDVSIKIGDSPSKMRYTGVTISV
jgi:hypothetical protein